jgi:predicted AAA+ superfamily ATPase
MYLPRLIDGPLERILATLPAVSLMGPRACGKTTSMRRLAASIVRLDRPREAALFQADPDVALTMYPRPTLLDEWHEVPEILGAVKRAVDEDSRVGQFLLTGSVRIGARYTWPATGRVVRQTAFGLTQREIERSTSQLFIDRVSRDVMALLDISACDLNIIDYLERSAAGGFPDLVLNRANPDARAIWLDSYMQEMKSNDVKLAGGDPDPGRFSAFIEAVALNSSRIVDQATLRDTAGVSKITAAAYEKLLESIFFSERVPAWRSDRLDRLAALPKRYVLDTSLLMHILEADVDTTARDGAILGSVLDTFVAAQLRPEIATQVRGPNLMHLRDKGGRHEVDLILEYPHHRVVGIEVKATSSPGLDDARHLLWLRDKLGDQFIGGVVLHTGPRAFALSSRVVAAPIGSLWR